MIETVRFSDEQKAIIRAINDQFEKNNTSYLFEYKPVEAQNFLIEHKFAKKLEINIREQFNILQELSAMELPVEIRFSKNDISNDGRTVTDGLHSSIELADDSDELLEKAFSIRVTFGSVYIRTTIPDMNKVLNLCEDYTAEFKLHDGMNYSVKCTNESGFNKTYNFPKLHSGSRAQIILEHVINHEGEKYKKSTINIWLKNKNDKKKIDEGKYLDLAIFGKSDALKNVLPYFFEIDKDSITFLSKTCTVTQSDIDLFEKLSA